MGKERETVVYRDVDTQRGARERGGWWVEDKEGRRQGQQEGWDRERGGEDGGGEGGQRDRETIWSLYWLPWLRPFMNIGQNDVCSCV